MDFKEFDHSIARNNRHPWELARIEVIERLITEFAPHDTSALVLEIGCGDSFVMESLAAKFPRWSFIGTDVAFPDSFLEKYKNDRITLYKTSAEAMMNIKQHVDIVLLLDVVEHVSDDVHFLQEILHFDGVDAQTNFIVTAPSFQGLFCSHDVFLQHYRRYSNESLSALFRNAGMNVVSMGYFFGSLLLTRVLRVGLEKLKLINPSQGLRNWRYPTLGSLLKFVLIQDFKIVFAMRKLGIKVPGLSNYAVCRKSE